MTSQWEARHGRPFTDADAQRAIDQAREEGAPKLKAKYHEAVSLLSDATLLLSRTRGELEVAKLALDILRQNDPLALDEDEADAIWVLLEIPDPKVTEGEGIAGIKAEKIHD